MHMCLYTYILLYVYILYVYRDIIVFIINASMQFTPYAYTQHTCIRRRKVGEAHRKGPFRSHTRTHPALPLVAQATKVAGIAGDHLPVTSLVLSSNKEHTNKIHAKFLYSQFIHIISYLFGGWGIGYITAVHRFLASANMFPSTPLKGRISQEACWTESSSSGKLQKMIKIISLAQQALFKKSTNFIAHKPILFS